MEQLKLNMIPNGVNPVFHASQYDKGRQIRFVLDETLSSAEVTTSYRAKDGTEHENVQTSVSGNTITDTIPEEVLTDYGMIEGEVNIDGIGSLNFFVEVEKDAYDGGSIITQTASGAIATFNTNMVEPIKSLKSDINPVQSGTGTPSPQNVRPISGFSALNVTLADGDMQTVDTKTVNFGQTVYGGVADVTNGKVTITQIAHVFDGSENFLPLASGRVFAYDFGVNLVGSYNNNNSLCSHFHEGYGAWDQLGVGEYLVAGVRYGGVNPDMTLADFRTYLQAQYNNGTPVIIVATLATPTEITTTPENLTAISGENNVFSDTNGDTEVKYLYWE